MTLALDGRRVLVGVGGSVAAYKACQVVTDLRRGGAEVRVAMTEAAARFVTPTLLRALSGHPVASSMWDDDAADDGHGMSHLDAGVVVRGPGGGRRVGGPHRAARARAGDRSRHRDGTRVPRPDARRTRDGGGDVGAPGDAGPTRRR